MKTTRASFVLLVCCAAVMQASPVPDTLSGEVVNLHLIRHQRNARVKRDVSSVESFSSMPDLLVMTMTLKKKEVVFRLHRAGYPPVYLVRKGGLQEVTNLDSAQSAVYVDPSRQASFTVKLAASGHYLLDGNFRHGTDQVSIKPVTRRKRSPGDNNNSHVVTKYIPQVIIIDPDDSDNSTDANKQTNSGRRKRSTDVKKYTIETAFVVDQTDYANFTQIFPDNTLQEIRDYYTQIGQTLNNIYSSVNATDPSIDIKVPIVGIYVIVSVDDAIVSGQTQIQGETYLKRFREWIGNHPNVTASDHYMAFTAIDIVKGLGQAVGLATVGVTCTSTLAVSVVENSFSGSVSPVAAHELGHSLNASHDTQGCNNSYTMSTSLNVPASPNTYRFSSCSVAAFKQFLATKTCALPNETSAAQDLVFTDYDFALIGDLDKQCQVALNYSGSEMCSFGSINMCVGMLCQLPNSDSCLYVLPLDGTSCGTDKICFLGVCEDETDVEQVPATFDSATEAPATAAPATDAPATEAPSTAAPATEAPATEAPSTAAPVTDAPATEAPSTAAPATDAPATEAPSTAAPATDAPATEAPSTAAPATDAPATEAPATAAPATDAPATEAPSTAAPATDAPATEAPSTAAPATDAPATEAPATAAPATDAPATEAPSTAAPATDAPATEAPATAAPATDAPATEAPATAAPATDAPATEAPSTAAPATDAPATEAPSTAAPATDAPATEAPSTAAPATDAPATEAPATAAPATDAPATEAPSTAAPATDAPATEAPSTAAPATDAPATEAPSTAAPATDAPATEAPATAAPATDAPATEAPSTAAPATDAPATEAPSTAAPATDAPATEAPSTAAPATDAPATEAPSTAAPATDAPATEAPSTAAPATDAPATEAPATAAPATDAPATETPSTAAPATDAPATEAPSTAAPATDAPATEAPSTAAPATDAPATEAPSTAAPTDNAQDVPDTTTAAPQSSRVCFRKCRNFSFRRRCFRYARYFIWRTFIHHTYGYPLPKSCCLVCLFNRGDD